MCLLYLLMSICFTFCSFNTALVAELESAIIEQRTNQHMSPYAIHSRVRELYKWQDVAKRTELVYDRIAREREIDLAERLHRSETTGISPPFNKTD